MMKTSVTYTFINFTVFSLQKVVTHSKLPQDTSVNIQIYTRETQQWVGTITFYVIDLLFIQGKESYLQRVFQTRTECVDRRWIHNLRHTVRWAYRVYFK